MAISRVTEAAIGYASLAGDVGSLATLARQEAYTADRYRRILAAVLAKTGPIELDASEMIKDRRIEWVSTEFGKKLTVRV